MSERRLKLENELLLNKSKLQGKDYDDVYVEDKKIEKLEQRTDTGLIGTGSEDMIEHTNRINRQAGYLSEIVSKINEIIDEVNKCKY